MPKAEKPKPVRRKRVKPTLQEYRARCAEAINDAPPVVLTSLDDYGYAVRTVDQDATHAVASDRLAALRAERVVPWQSWRDHYAEREDGDELAAKLELAIAELDAEADDALAAKVWELS